MEWVSYVDESAVSPDGRTAVTVARGGTPKVWETRSGRVLADIDVPDGSATALAFAPDGALVAVGQRDGGLWLWTPDGRRVADLPAHTSAVRAVAFSGDGRTVVSGGQDGGIQLHRLDGRPDVLFDGTEGHEVGFHRGVRGVSIDASGRRVAMAGHYPLLRVWDVKSEVLVADLRTDGGWVGAVALSSSGSEVAYGSRDGVVEVVELAEGRRRVLGGHFDGVLAIAFSSDGRLLATGGMDGLVKIWNVDTGAEVRVLEGLGGWVRTVAFADRDAVIIGCDRGGETVTWNAEGELLARSRRDDVVTREESEASWARVAARYDWSRMNCGCGRGGAHIPANFADLVAATTPEQADGRGLENDVEVQAMLFESMIPVVSMIVAALRDEPLSPWSRVQMLRLLSTAADGETHISELRRGREDLEAECRQALRPAVPFLRSMSQNDPSPAERMWLDEILGEMDDGY